MSVQRWTNEWGDCRCEHRCLMDDKTTTYCVVTTWCGSLSTPGDGYHVKNDDVDHTLSWRQMAMNVELCNRCHQFSGDSKHVTNIWRWKQRGRHNPIINCSTTFLHPTQIVPAIRLLSPLLSFFSSLHTRLSYSVHLFIVLLYLPDVPLLNISSCFHFFVAKHLWNHLFSSASRGSVTGVCPTEQNKSGEGRKKSWKKRNNFFSDLSFRKGVMNYILKGETEASCLYAFIEFQWREEASAGGEIQLAFATSARTVSNHSRSPWRCLTSCKLQHPFWHPEKVELSFN